MSREDQLKISRREFQKQNTLPKILIVTDMLLTGFDAPIERVMYLDKPLRDHKLLLGAEPLAQGAPVHLQAERCIAFDLGRELDGFHVDLVLDQGQEGPHALDFRARHSQVSERLAHADFVGST